MYQKWPNHIFPFVNFVFCNCGHFGLGRGGRGLWAAPPLWVLITLKTPCHRHFRPMLSIKRREQTHTAAVCYDTTRVLPTMPGPLEAKRERTSTSRGAGGGSPMSGPHGLWSQNGPRKKPIATTAPHWRRGGGSGPSGRLSCVLGHRAVRAKPEWAGQGGGGCLHVTPLGLAVVTSG